MTLPVWPSELMAPLQDGFNRGSGEGRMMRQSDTGPRRPRRRFSAVSRPVTLAIVMTRDELARFDRFYDEETKGGSLPFAVPDPMTDGWPLLADDGSALLTDEGVPILLSETWLAVFSEQLPQTAPFGALEWRVSFGIAVMP